MESASCESPGWRLPFTEVYSPLNHRALIHQYTSRGPTDHFLRFVFSASAGLAVPLLPPHPMRFLRGSDMRNDHQSSFRSSSCTISSTVLRSNVSSTSVLRRVCSDAPVLHLHVSAVNQHESASATSTIFNVYAPVLRAGLRLSTRLF